MPRPRPVVLLRPTSARSVRTALLELAYSLGVPSAGEEAGRPAGGAGELVLVDAAITLKRLRQEWEQAAAVLRPEVSGRMQVWAVRGPEAERLDGAADPRARARVLEAADRERRSGRARARRDAEFAVFQVLLHQWLEGLPPVTSEALAARSGFSYPSVAKALRKWGTILERTSDRRVGFAGFPREEFERMRALADRARATARFAERGRGPARTVEAQRARLAKLRPPGVAIGGAAAALHWCPDLDLTGPPRLDLSAHAPDGRLDLGFVAELDPGLAPVADPHAPATLVVHAVPHADSLFAPAGAGLPWAGPVECLFDLHEARLEAPAAEFLEFLLARRERLRAGAR